jgi:hypothetical protein
MRTETVTFIHYYEFEKIVKEHYGQEYEFVADVECGNDSDHTYKIEKEELSKWNTEDLTEFKLTGKYGWLARTLFQDLVNKDILQPGAYVVQVSW